MRQQTVIFSIVFLALFIVSQKAAAQFPTYAPSPGQVPYMGPSVPGGMAGAPMMTPATMPGYAYPGGSVGMGEQPGHVSTSGGCTPVGRYDSSGLINQGGLAASAPIPGTHR